MNKALSSTLSVETLMQKYKISDQLGRPDIRSRGSSNAVAEKRGASHLLTSKSVENVAQQDGELLFFMTSNLVSELSWRFVQY